MKRILPWTLPLILLGCQSEVPAGADRSTDGPPDPGTTTSDPTPSTGTTPPGPGDAPNFGNPGGVPFSVSDGSVPAGDCTLSYTRYAPDAPVSEVWVVLSHGFMRGSRHMAGWAEHLAGWGLQVVTPELCHATALDSDHVQNGLDLNTLAASLASDVIYIGHSAGGLASMLAGAGDPGAIAVLGLDPVDAADLGVEAAAGLTVPAAALLAEPSMCNTQNNGLQMTHAASDAQVMGIPGTDHCSFEHPSDAGCTLFCGGEDGPLSAQEVEETVGGLMVAYALWHSGAVPDAQQWWVPGEVWFERLVADGRIEVR